MWSGIWQGVGKEGKELCVLHELGNKMQLGEHCGLLNGFNRGPGGKAFEKCTIFSLSNLV